ncbi:hypothetical protein JOC95_000265 [Bacillus tianshenii]|uniref:DUF5317 domain-containing protein n=1 Tax=Sutcliffiella tianshenii TaxID=1463404 RepID=A0ABS2NUU2_9BACI|nr:DUF5317 domain-containing protein [Bacillus tianshenii]MBM7618423.1 hypothetical protein [Bacillus tianshenii]
MVYDGIIIALLVGLFRGGNFKGLADMKIKQAWVFPVLLMIQIVIYILQNKIPILGFYSNTIFILVYLVGMYFLWLNRHHPGFVVIFIGVFLNFLVMALNGGRMPVSIEASAVLDPYFVEALKNGLYGKHAAITESTRLAFLGDIIPLSAPYPREQIISIGDVIMNIGVFFFIQYLMIGKIEKNSTPQVTTTN